jgi:hypothetical protein
MPPDMEPQRHFFIKAQRETKVPHTPGPQHNVEVTESKIALCTTTAESANASSPMPFESTLTTFKLQANHSTGSKVT